MFEMYKNYLERVKYNLLNSNYFWRIGLGKVDYWRVGVCFSLYVFYLMLLQEGCMNFIIKIRGKQKEKKCCHYGRQLLLFSL